MTLKEWVRPALAFFWSVAWVVIFVGSGQLPPDFVSGITATTVSWFFVSREVEKKRESSGSIQKALD